MPYEIYMVECPLGRRYVGATSRGAAYRWRTHFGNPPREWPGDDRADIADAIKRHGRKNFSFRVLAMTLTVEDAAAIETFMIAHYGALSPKGYNRDAASNLKQRTVGQPRWLGEAA